MSAAGLTDGVYATAAIATLWLAFLKVHGALGRGPAGWAWKAGLGVAAVLLAILPLKGVVIWRWGLGVFPNPSIPLVGLVGAALIARLFGVQLLTASDRRDAWWFGALAGGFLYPHAWGLWSFDLYSWGWRRELWIWGLAILVAVLSVAGRRIAALVLLALIGYTLDLLESDNGWDYLVDPVYWILGTGVLLRSAAGSRMGRRVLRRSTAPEKDRDRPQ